MATLLNLLKGGATFARETAATALAHVMVGGREAVGSAVKQGTETFIKKNMEEHRAELRAFIEMDLWKRDKVATENILQRWREWNKKPGEENRNVQLLTKAFRDLSQEPDLREEFFVALGNMGDAEFNETIEFLRHDPFIQYIKKGWSLLKETDAALGPVAGKLKQFADRQLEKCRRKGYDV